VSGASHSEWELKAVVPDWDGLVARLRAHDAAPEFEGRMEDRRYDTAAGDLAAGDHVLRLRAYRDDSGALVRATLDWKGPTERRAGYKVREERSTAVGDPAVMHYVLDRLGYQVMTAIDRTILQFAVHGASVRLERYPRMDDLVEVEGDSVSIEAAIRALGLSRESFTTDALASFVERFEARTGTTAAISMAELAGDARRDRSDA